MTKLKKKAAKKITSMITLGPEEDDKAVSIVIDYPNKPPYWFPELPYTEENAEFCGALAKELDRKVCKKHAK